MFGSESDFGVIQRSLSLLQKLGAELYVSALEVYNNKAFDLTLESNNAVANIGKLNYTKLNENVIDSFVTKVKNSRISRDNLKNEKSSRSHLVLKVKVFNSESHNEAIINFVDLAGNERMDSTASKTQTDETKFINSSLLGLKKCVVDQFKKVYNKNLKINFSENLLTKLLKDSLNFKRGESDTFSVIIANVSTKEEDIQ